MASIPMACEQLGIHVPCTPWFLPHPGDGQPNMVACLHGARGKPCSVAVTEMISFCFAPGHKVNPAVKEGVALLMCCVPLPSSSQSLHSRGAWRLTESTQGPGGLFQRLLKKAGGGLNEGEQMVWGGCSYTRLKNSSLPCTSLMQAAQSTWQTTQMQFLGVFLIFFLFTVWDTHLFHWDTLPPQSIAPECFPHDEPKWSPWKAMIICFLLSCLSCPFMALLNRCVQVHLGWEESGELGDIHWLGCATARM